ncbi:LysR family transcriptional regulator [Xanthobacter autotrophicus]|uniref:LysR family transcriptional regulator n=1 Tax=Xanthobacter autotrophicus TaxID=280 RepID=UPI00372C4FF8
MPAELRDMRWAIAAAEHRSLRQAAEALRVRESTLSRRLRDLEYRLGAELFERSANGTRLTAAGDEFIAVAKRILAEADAAFSRMRARGRGESGDLVVGLCMALSVGNLRATLAAYIEQHQAVVVHGIDGARSRLLADLTTGNIDVFLTAAGHVPWNGALLPLWSEQVMVALPANHALCESPVIGWPDLADARVLVNRRDPGPDFETMLRTRLGSGCGCVFIGHDVCLDRFLGFVAAGLGLTLVSESAAGTSDRGIVYRELHDDEGPVRIRFAAYWKETNRNPALRPFLDLLRERYSDTAPALSSE